MKHIRKRLTYANVMSSLAVFLVLGGAAVAASILPKNSVGTRELKPKAVKTGILARNAVRTGKVGPEAIKAGKLAQNAVPTNRIRDNAVTGDKVNESSLSEVPNAAEAGKVGGVPASALTIGRSNQDLDCFGAANYTCASLTLEMPRNGRVLLVSQLPMHPDAENSSASCHLTLNGVEIPDTTTTPGANEDADSDQDSEIANGGVTVVTDVIAAGSNTFTQVCSDTGGNPHFRRSSLSAVLLGTD